MIKIGITGSIGTGKTTIGNMLKIFNIPVFNSDKIVGKILKSNESVKKQINKIWPGVLIKKQNVIDKNKLRKIIFANTECKKKLEKIIHPLVENERIIFTGNHKKRKILAFDVPLLYEKKQQKKYDYIFLASCSYSLQKIRVLKRVGMDESIFMKINETQISTSDKIKMKPIVIKTDKLKVLTFIDIMIIIFRIKFKIYIH